jgi:hypothetical protein
MGRPLLVAAVLGLLTLAAEARGVREYDREDQAQKHCPKDTVVWSEFKGGGLFHLKGSPRYGKTPDGGYLCRQEAERAGWREFRKSE